jgi:predicted lipid-binding transport protein (Tim44 family)
MRWREEFVLEVEHHRRLRVPDENHRHVVSVRFSGQIRESADGEATAFDEIWHLSKPASGPGGWVIAGIQQG